MNKAVAWMKKHKVISSLIIASTAFYLWYDMPFKATDPNSPYFVESLFRWRDYKTGENRKEFIEKVIPKLFPIGTPKEYVDLMLAERGGAMINDKTNFAVGNYAYIYTPIELMLTPNSVILDAYYDENDKLLAIHFGGKFVVGQGYKTKLIEWRPR